MRRAALHTGLVAVAVGVCSTATEADTPKAEAGVKVSGIVYAAAPEGEKPTGKKTVAGAAVHVRDLPAGWDPKPFDEPLRLSFSKGRISPEFACLQVGQKVVIKALEGETFSLRAYSPARGDFGELVPRNPTLFTDTFPKPDNVVTINCAIHPTARAQLQVVPTPGFALCDAGGRFTLPRRLPKGEHVLKGFYPGVGFAEKAVALRGDEGEVAVELYLAPRSKPKESKR